MTAPAITHVPDQVVAHLTAARELLATVQPHKRDADRVRSLKRLVSEAQRKAAVKR